MPLGQRVWSSAYLLLALAVAYVSVFPSVLAYIFYNRGVELIGGARAGAFMHLIPLFGAVFAIGLLGETLTPYHGVGFALIVAGVMLAARR
ncbi:MAG: EamA family transporter [Methyloligellaceae bacterium]